MDRDPLALWAREYRRLQQRGKLTPEALAEFAERLPPHISVEDILDFIDAQPVVPSNNRRLIIGGVVALVFLIGIIATIIIGVVLYPRLSTPPAVPITFSGRVAFSNGDSLVGAPVSVALENSDQPPKESNTDEHGNYTIVVQMPNDKPGRYRICVALPPNLGGRKCERPEVNPAIEQSVGVDFAIPLPTPTPTRVPTFTPMPSPQPTVAPVIVTPTLIPVRQPVKPGVVTPTRGTYPQ